MGGLTRPSVPPICADMGGSGGVTVPTVEGTQADDFLPVEAGMKRSVLLLAVVALLGAWSYWR